MLEHAAGTGDAARRRYCCRPRDRARTPKGGSGHLLAGVPTPPSNPPRQPEPEPLPAVVQQLLPPQLTAYLDQPSREPEHRTVAVAFLRFDGTDAVLAEDGAEALTTAIDAVLRNVQHATTAHDVSPSLTRTWMRTAERSCWSAVRPAVRAMTRSAADRGL